MVNPEPPPPVFMCPACTTTTRHPNDVHASYCPVCHWWTADPLLAPERPDLFTRNGRTPPERTHQ